MTAPLLTPAERAALRDAERAVAESMRYGGPATDVGQLELPQAPRWERWALLAVAVGLVALLAGVAALR